MAPQTNIFLFALLSLAASNPLLLERALPTSTVAALGMDTRLHPAAKNYVLFAVSASRKGGDVELGAATIWLDVGNPNHSTLAAMLSPDTSTEAVDPCVAVVLINVVIFLAWQCTPYPASQALQRHTTASADNLAAGRLWTLITSSVSHTDPMHLLCNLVFFTQAFRTSVAIKRHHLSASSPATFWAFFAAAAVFSAATSIVINRVMMGRRYYETSGLSGVIYALWALIACGIPQARFTLFGFTTTAWGMMALNLLLSIFKGSRRLDVGCHLGGMIYGMLFSTVCGAGFRIKLPNWASVLTPLLGRLETLGRPRGWECRDGPLAAWLGTPQEDIGGSWWGWATGGAQSRGVTRRAWVLGQWACLFGLSVSVLACVIELRAARADDARRRSGYA